MVSLLNGAWLSKPGSLDVFVKDASSLTAALQAGYVYPTAPATARSPSASHVITAGAPITPKTVVSPTLTVVQVSVNGEQDDGR